MLMKEHGRTQMKTSTKALIAAGAVTVGGFLACLARAETFPYLANGSTNQTTGARQSCMNHGGAHTNQWAALGITDEQKAQVKAVLQQYQPTAGPLIKQLVTERRALRDLIHAATIDESAIRAQAAKVASLQADLDVQRAHVSHDIRALLTPEQLQKLQDRQVNVDDRIDHFLQRVAKRIAED